MRTPIIPTNTRRILCVFPAYTPSFGTFAHAYKLLNGVRAFMPPQGLLVIAAYLPEAWPVRFVDESIAAARDEDYVWADAVFVSGMHIQAPQMHAIADRAHRFGKVVILGGPSVSGSPHAYADFDYLHVGELGDATDQVIATLDQTTAVPAQQVTFETRERVALGDFPIPAYEQAPLKRYLIGSLQFSSGCPYQCEFCDIPALYGRQPRLKSPDRLLAELDAIMAQPSRPPLIYFVDDNFIGNRKATREMLPHLIAWQRKHDYPLEFACEATLNIAKQPDILALMREAAIVQIFVGIETPELDALKSMAKSHNASVPMLDAIATINSFGMEVTSGIIIGLDSDSDASEGRLKRFVDESQAPILTMNLLQALPKTPLWDRLSVAGRLTSDPALESNVRFLRPHDEVVASWQRLVAYAYDPERLFARFLHQVDATYVHRFAAPAKGKLTAANLKRGLVLALNIVWRIGVLSDYRRPFWRVAGQAVKRGRIEDLFGVGFAAFHLIQFSREVVRGEHNASFYSARAREPARRRRWYSMISDRRNAA